MYPDWPKPDTDLVPLPRWYGPKLEPFKFQGSQEIEFLELIGSGLHSSVFKVRIEGKIYALKMFRFADTFDWKRRPPEDCNQQVWNHWQYCSEPFNCECRAYGRLREAGYEDLVTKCYGYVLLNEEQEHAAKKFFCGLDDLADLDDINNRLEIEYPGDDWVEPRKRFLLKDGREAPVRCIIKEFGQGTKLTTRLARKLLKDIIKLQQLGIIDLDLADRQIINGKISDFSCAVTLPHFPLSLADLGPGPRGKDNLELEIFCTCISDYWDFDQMICEWNLDNKDNIKVRAIPRESRYDLRRQPTRRFYTLVDPRKCASFDIKPGGYVPLDPRKLGRGAPKKLRPTRWYYDCDSAKEKYIRRRRGHRGQVC
ncbi:kinetochore Sim4 complex subunit FTA2-domain-containing protein [Hypoxylon trugodes]|uniref:kinetochore Sim4 complex subunit FTA2-domain-containing protein n=1 Tax=Hypoxylon trugodes TaxID=326681 RepID=UPI00218CC763|nr:kinetochore Sim4 complex subunit FTA2-domain-containing protein [Hypoxylon trugodes]KAI1387201.1 kinetochore Sim4 complex subunit FTA2-domain-containing protein [Hypoxylon trugodes]